ncbi:hypothetical protein COCCADRAFT_39759 [Bipolaris zeicola 26-R-13]|uniref:Uncharacterized protein n=1 Tax=Cochliobolus carbonum (strain 26-R-13) TaxID=930089 RepID=W6YFC8_COCC2|nr:uncharacterized protein COCCADRAFT_39759 [Bipolaris zeicola 26-R-13]EUC29936.1 hypothetical protein COCCADRAFT_39759 [Bipolaris zeicola 26-R-13]
MTDPRPVSANIAVLLHEDGSRPLTHSDAMPMGNSRLPRPMSTYKPLPSPPIAQVSSPNSPPKAQRTLIDAQSESSIHGRWPVLHPENVSPPSNSLAQDSYDGAGDDRSIRLKPLSWHASDADANAHTGTGPILKISADADEFILGTGDDIPEVPPIPAVFTERLQQTRSFSNLRARLAEVTEYKSSLSNAPPAPTVHPVRTLRSLTPVVKISPIRSMQPARKVSPASHSPMSSSPLARPSTSSNSEDKVVVITADNTTRATNHSDHHMKLTGSASKPTIIVSEPTASPEIFESTESRQEFPAPLSGYIQLPDDEPVLEVKKTGIRKTITSIMNSKSSPNLKDNSGNETKSWRMNPFNKSSLSLYKTAQSHDTVRNPDSDRLRTAETVTSETEEGSSSHETSQQRQSYQSDDHLMDSSVAPSAPEDTSSDKQDRGMTEKKIRAKRSIRDIFTRGRSRTGPEEPMPTTKQGFLSATSSSLTKAMRDAKSYSMVNLAVPTESRPQTAPAPSQKKDKGKNPPIPLSAGLKLNSTCASPDRKLVPDERESTRTLIEDMLERLDTQPRDSSEHLRIVQMAECVMSAALSAKNCEDCAEEAKQNARSAEICLGMATMDLERLYNIVDFSDLDTEVASGIKRLGRLFRTGGKPDWL